MAIGPSVLLRWSPVAITSGSMEPTIGAGDVVLAQPVDPLDVGRGSIAVFFDAQRNSLVTHRVVDINGDGTLVTKGDANPTPDSDPVDRSALIGAGRLVVPFIGSVVVSLRQGDWMRLTVFAIGAALCLYACRFALHARYDPWVTPRPTVASPTQLGPKLLAGLPVALLMLAVLLPASARPASAAFTASTSNASSSLQSDALNPPTALGATGGGSVTLSWTATIDTYATGHRIFRSSTPGGPYTQVAQITPRSTTTFVDSPPNGTYYYVARAYASTWESANSNETSATVRAVGLADSWQTGLSHPVASGTNRILVLVASNEQQTTTTPSLTGVTYGGQPLTHVISSEVTSTGITDRIEIWILKEAGIAAAVGTTIAPTWTGPPDTPLYSHAIFNNVNQPTPVGASTFGSAPADVPNPVPTSPLATSMNDMVLGAAVAGEAGTYSPQNGFLLGVTQSTTVGGTTSQGTAYKGAIGSPETVSMLFNSGSPPFINRQVVLGLVLQVAP